MNKELYDKVWDAIYLNCNAWGEIDNTHLHIKSGDIKELETCHKRAQAKIKKANALLAEVTKEVKGIK